MAGGNRDKPGFPRRAFVNGAAAGVALAAGSVAGMGSAHASPKSASSDPGTSDAPADLLLTNGNVLTLDGRNTVAKSVSIRDGRIVAVGTGGAAKQVVNLRGATIIPGLNDSHIHFIRLGTNPGYGVRDIEVAQSIEEEMQQIISGRAATVPAGRVSAGQKPAENGPARMVSV